MMNSIKSGPLLWLLISSGLLFSLLGLAGKDTIYAKQEYHPAKEPLFSVMFSAMNEGIYPWQLFEEPALKKEDSKKNDSRTEAIEDSENNSLQTDKLQEDKLQEEGEPEKPVEELPTAKDPGGSPQPSAVIAAEPTIAPESMASPTPLPPIEPIRETTREEYLNHISADIYGDAGIRRAAEYEFVPVDMTWFDDALFIGDSRTVGLRDYTEMSDYAEFYCETSMTVYKVFESNYSGKGKLKQALEEKDYKKIYIMVGINELGTGTTEDYMAKYTELVTTIRELEPDALIFIQGVMRVTDERSKEDKIFNNQNINARNNAIATLADNQRIFYIDVNEAICDENGGLHPDYTYDQIHLLGKYNYLWKDFLLTKGVAELN